MKFSLIILFIATINAKLKITPRITGGFPATQGLIRCYVYLVSSGDNSLKECGGCVIDPGIQIVTAASCVTSPEDGILTSIKFYNTLLGPTGPSANYNVSSVSIAPGFNISSNISLNDIAVIQLTSRVQTALTFGSVSPILNTDSYVRQNLLVCGHGFVNNSRVPPGVAGLQCTTLRIVPNAECASRFLRPELVGRRKR